MTHATASRSALYVLLGVLITVGFAAFVTGLSLILGSAIQVKSPLILGGVIFLLALLFHPLRQRLQTWTEQAFEQKKSSPPDRLQLFSIQLAGAPSQSAILDLIRLSVKDAFHPAHAHIFVRNSATDNYETYPEEDGLPTSDLRFTADSPFVKTLSELGTPFYVRGRQTMPLAMLAERARLLLLGCDVYIPMQGCKYLVGWLALSSSASGNSYTDQDMIFLESLCDQAALALERFQVIANLERRMQDMDVLMRVSQGINITLAFDDILELVYAQTTHIIPVKDFWISLYNQSEGFLYHAFYLENDERLADKENIPLDGMLGLEREVLKTRRPYITADYERECRNRGLLQISNEISVWAGIPLNSGAETIGVMSLGHRNPLTIIGGEQIQLLQAIADQAAGAIVKARLLQEAERRATQLAALNEVGRSLSSNLAPTSLLEQILGSAVDILNCEAGNLFLVDEQTGDLIHKVAVGHISTQTLGNRLPADKRLVGNVLISKKPLIVRDVQHEVEGYAKSGEQAGLHIHSLLIVPMLAMERVVGVIEVINRKDGLPLTEADQEMLSAFTSHAAVAMENARLYTLTDQALAERVEELSVMQRIDQELNSSLDVQRAMGITLEWAMRQAKSEAGLVGAVSEGQVRVMASAGYPPDLIECQNGNLGDDIPSLKSTMESGTPKRISLPANNGNHGLLPKARGQVIVPIRRETEAIGFILLESGREEIGSPETMEFLSRLSDHAAIAIANARLYAELESANMAKSEFVSFVSHELKTPMTSIKGFTDLLARGIVGPVNETQANFLNTIRSNVDRMATLVSDLADVSRIEAGRLRLDFTAVSLPEVIEEVTRTVKREVELKEQALETQAPEDLPKAWADRMRLIQILTNLTSNAYKYTPNAGKILLRAEVIEASSVPVTEADLEGEAGEKVKGQVIHVMVQDSGYGISPEDQAKIFQKFFRSEDQNIRESTGTGLGLNIARTLVEMQGGKIWFESELGQGTTFHFTVPVAEAG